MAGDDREWALASSRLVTRDSVSEGVVHMRGGKILAVRPRADFQADCELLDVGDAVVMPGLVDSHVHINEPGRTEWEGFETATRAAAAGGVTTLMDMPLNSIPATTSPEGLDDKLMAARGKCWVDVGFCGGVVAGNLDQLRGLHERGVLAFKCFLVPSGVDEFPMLPVVELRPALQLLAELGSTLLVHAELPGPIEAAAAVLEAEPGLDRRSYASFLRSRPRAAENDAVALLLELVAEVDAAVHVVHLSSADPLPWLREAQQAGLPISAETCPHYLCLSAEQIPDGRTEFKCCPPIREAENRERLWQGLLAGTISLVVSDHSPSPAALKCCDSGDFMAAWGGISSLQLRLPLIWSEARQRGVELPQLCRWLCSEPARLIGLEARKGSLEPGADADLVVWEPEKSVIPSVTNLRHRHKLSPYLEHPLVGRVLHTVLRGERVFSDGRLAGGPFGRRLLRT